MESVTTKTGTMGLQAHLEEVLNEIGGWASQWSQASLDMFFERFFDYPGLDNRMILEVKDIENRETSLVLSTEVINPETSEPFSTS